MKLNGRVIEIAATGAQSLHVQAREHRIAGRRSSAVVGAVSTAALVLLAACVPSPTATPPLATAFPTLALPTDTPPPTATVTGAAPTAVPPSPTLTATVIPLITRASPAATAIRGTLPPLIQVTAFPSTGPVSSNQPVGLTVMAASKAGIGRLELYDENVLYSTNPSPDPPPPMVSTVLTWKSSTVGMHHLRLVAYDSAGNISAAAALEFMVLNDNRAPLATITVPIGEIELPIGSPFVLQGVATDEVAVKRVDLFVDNQLYTYVDSNKPSGESPLAVSLMWIPTSAGMHQLFLRAHDNADGTGDSPPLLANVIDVQGPSVIAGFERDEIGANGTLLVHAFALSPNRIARMELWADNQVVQVVESTAPDAQTTLDAQLIWEGAAVGDHTLFVRAYDRAGLNSSTPPQIIHVRQQLTQAAATPTAAAITPTAAVVLATSTPQAVLPDPPTVQLTTAADRSAALLPGPVAIHLATHGSVELDHVELWAYYQGQINPQLLFSDGAKGATDKAFDYSWNPVGAGVVLLFARVVDQLGQTGVSPVTSINLVAPPAPTPTPAFFNLAARWVAQIPTNMFTADFSQFGSALRGTFTNAQLNGPTFSGLIVAGSVDRDRVVFSVDFDAPDAVPRSLDFECLPSSAPPQLACNYQDETGSRGSAVFTPAQ